MATIEVAVRTPPLQRSVWLTLQERADPRDWFISNVINARLGYLEKKHWDQTPEILLIGSSQTAAGFDTDLLRKLLTGHPVRKVAVGDMDCVRMFFARPYCSIGPNDHVVLYLSSRDIMDSRIIRSNWMRPFATFQGIVSIVSIQPTATITSFREFCDLTLASTFELWRSRDAYRHILTHLQADTSADLRTDAQRGLQAQMDDGVETRSSTLLEQLLAGADNQLAALKKMIAHIQSQGAVVTILEGQINPNHRTEQSDALQAKLHSFLSTNAHRLNITYIPFAEQNLDFPQSDWNDATHLNDTGAEKLTKFLATRLLIHQGGVLPAPGIQKEPLQ